MEPMADASNSEKRILQRAWDMKFPVNGSLELLPLCNMNCDMCYVRLTKEEANRIGRIRTADEWLSIGNEMRQAGVLFMLLTGGEPLLHPGFKKIYLGLRDMGMIVSINSNGTLIDEEWADFFAKYPPRRINITLYGSCNETYESLCHYPNGYDRTIRALKLLKDRNIDIRLGCSVTTRNAKDLEAFFAIRDELGVYGIADTYMVSATRERNRAFAFGSRCTPEEAARHKLYVLHKILGEQNWPVYVRDLLWDVDHIVTEEKPGGVYCYAGNCSFAVSWLGEMHPCVTMTTPSANVFDLGFMQAWQSITQQVAQIRTSSRCQNCKFKSFCPSCAGNALVESGNYDGTPDYLCRYSAEAYRLFQVEARRLNIDQTL